MTDDQRGAAGAEELGPGEATLTAWAQQAQALLQRGLGAQADSVCRRILAAQPRHFHALHLLGISALQVGAADRAVELFRAAIAAEPAQAPAHSNLAAALLARREPLAALDACELALEIQPSLAGAWTNRGNAYFELRRYDEALASLERARRLNPGSEQVLNDLARTLLRLRRPDAALMLLDEALRRAPVFSQALHNRGSALRELGRPAEALASYERALASNGDAGELHSNMANVLLHLGRTEEAIAACDRALAARAGLAEALNIRAQALGSLQRWAEAAATLEKLLDVAGDFDYAAGNYFFAKAQACDWARRTELAGEIECGVAAGRRIITPLAYLSLADSPEAQLQCARTCIGDAVGAALAAAPPRQRTHDRLHLAYVSSDFNDHPVAHLLAGVLEQHDRERFEVHAISLNRDRRNGEMYRRLGVAVEHFHDLSGSSDQGIARRIRELEIDIAVDLNGHTRGGRLGILSHRPAPLQVSYLGYTGTTGASFIDYVIGDDVALPPAVERGFSERVVRMPHSFLPNDDRQFVSPVSYARSDLGLPADGFVFCAFNNPFKITPTVFDVWMRLLRDIPNSVLWLKGDASAMSGNLRLEAVSRGVEPERLVFAPMVAAMDRHLARYRAADLFLDTLPYGAHATARDALWAGLPVLTCLGKAFAGRVAASLLKGLGLDELVAANLEEYRECAAALAKNRPALSALRAKLARRRAVQPAFSTAAYRVHLEAAYETMMRRHECGLPPESFRVPDWAQQPPEPR